MIRQQLLEKLDDKALNILGVDRSGEKAMIGDPYKGASTKDVKHSMWQPGLNDANQDILPSKPLADARSRDIIRNDAYVSNGDTLHKDSIVGAKFFLNLQPAYETLGKDRDWAEAFAAEVEEKFTLYAESPENYIDAAGKMTLTDLTRLAVGVMLYGGEVLATAEWIKRAGRPYSTAIQMVEADRLCSPESSPLTFNRSRQLNVTGGIRHDNKGYPLGYYIRKNHISDIRAGADHNFQYVPARKQWGRQQVIHIIDQKRPGQMRGISELVSALKQIRSLSHFQDLELERATLQATFAATLESDMPTSELANQIGATAGEENLYENYAMDFLSAADAYSRGGKSLLMGGSRIPHLFPGTKLNLTSPGDGGPLGTEFEASLLRYISASLGVSYEELSKDYTKTNYSSARAGLNNTWKYMRARKRACADRFASMIFRLWFEEAFHLGHIDALKGSNINIYEGQNLDALTRCEWIGSARGQIDELKETQAANLRVKSKLSTLKEEFAKQGMDWREQLSQMAREQEVMEELGLSFEHLDAENALSATPQVREPKGANVEDGN